jgi:hypothetical protein
MGKPDLHELADIELALLADAIAQRRALIRSKHFEWLGFSAIDDDGNFVPLPCDDTIQAQYDRMVERVAAMKCYKGLCARDTAGYYWIKGFLKAFRLQKQEFEALRMDVIDHTMALVFLVGMDTTANAGFNFLYGPMFYRAMDVLYESMPPTANEEARVEFAKGLMMRRTLEYSARAPMRRFFPGAGSLSTAALVEHVAELFRINLQRWDRTHGLALPRVRRMLEVFAYELVPQFDQGVYDLSALFNKVV